MNETELDRLLNSSSSPISREAEQEVRRMAVATSAVPLHRGRSPRRRLALPVLVGGGLALTAGASTLALAMAHWGGVSMPLENVRNESSIPVEWTTEAGHSEQCRAWIELENAERDDGERLDSAIDEHDWSGLGQRLYDSATPEAADPEGESRVADALSPVLRQFATEVFPGLLWMESGESRGVAATGMTCVQVAE